MSAVKHYHFKMNVEGRNVWSEEQAQITVADGFVTVKPNEGERPFRTEAMVPVHELSVIRTVFGAPKVTEPADPVPGEQMPEAAAARRGRAPKAAAKEEA